MNLTMTSEIMTAPLITTYRYARATDDSCELARVTISDDHCAGHGEGSPFSSFFNKDASGTHRALERAKARIEAGVPIQQILDNTTDMPARNALDAAWIDFRAKSTGTSAAAVLGIDPPTEQVVMTTIAMGSEKEMTADLHRTRHHPLLKIKLGDPHDRERLALVRRHRPDARLVVDVNGGWTLDQLETHLSTLVKNDVEMIEQPLPPTADRQLESVHSPIPVVADESFSTIEDLPRLTPLYNGINIKLDKCGGLSAALECIDSAKSQRLRIMVGCLPASSLSTAAGILAAQFAEWVDLDNHLWMRDDIDPPVPYTDGRLSPASTTLWG